MREESVERRHAYRLLHLNGVDLDTVELVTEVVVEIEHVVIAYLLALGLFRQRAHLAASERQQRALQFLLLDARGLGDVFVRDRLGIVEKKHHHSLH
jgi:hypothetical protein